MKVHGGNVHRASEETGIPVGEIIDFSASINPLGMPEAVVAAVREHIPLLVHYPDPFGTRLANHIGRWAGVEPRSVICGNGSTELIYLLVRALAPRRVLVPAPTFSEYERACRMEGAEIAPLALSPSDGFTIDPERFRRELAGCDMAFLCNPNNPTGSVMNRDTVQRLAQAARTCGCRLVVDEAFIDFVPEQSVTADAGGNEQLIVLRSLTKFYALAGLRIGYAVLHPAVADRVREHKEPWTVNTLAEQAAVAAINDRGFRERTLALITEEREFLAQGFRSLGIRWFPAAANYFLLRLERAQGAAAAMLRRGVLVRDCSNFTGLDRTYLRVAVRSRTENERLLKELAACAA